MYAIRSYYAQKNLDRQSAAEFPGEVVRHHVQRAQFAQDPDKHSHSGNYSDGLKGNLSERLLLITKFHVITSYSIHYTKLYDPLLLDKKEYSFSYH